MFLLDTNVISNIFRGNKNIMLKAAKIDDNQLFTCSIVEAEIFFGVDNSRPERQELLNQFYTEFFANITVLSFDSNSAQVFRKIKSKLWKMGESIENFDIAIASIALSNNLTLITNNTKHFEKIVGLKVEDWSKEGIS